jgi:hypothetical protein
MSFSITASNKYGPISLIRKTSREAFDLAMSYKRKGFVEIRVSNIQTGEVFAEQQIMDDRLPNDPRDSPTKTLPNDAAKLTLRG